MDVIFPDNLSYYFVSIKFITHSRIGKKIVIMKMNETYKTTIFHTKSNYFFGSILNFSRLFDAIQIRNYSTVCRLRSKCYFSLASREIRLIHTFFNVLLIFAQSQCFKSFRFNKYQIFTGKCLPLPLKSNNLFPIPCTQFSHEIHVRETLRFSRIEMN